jgi:hypothetical protein
MALVVGLEVDHGGVVHLQLGHVHTANHHRHVHVAEARRTGDTTTPPHHHKTAREQQSETHRQTEIDRERERKRQSIEKERDRRDRERQGDRQRDTERDTERDKGKDRGKDMRETDRQTESERGEMARLCSRGLPEAVLISKHAQRRVGLEPLQQLQDTTPPVLVKGERHRTITIAPAWIKTITTATSLSERGKGRLPGPWADCTYQVHPSALVRATDRPLTSH